MVASTMFAALCKKFSSRVAWATLLFVCAQDSGAIEPAELDDVAARMQYAYYTRDERALRAGVSDLERLSVQEDAQVWREYELGIAYWRLAELSRPGSALTQSLNRCEEHLTAAERLRPTLVEARAVRGLCAIQRSNARAANGTSKRNCSHQADIIQAVERAPRNPRVLYVQALCALQDGDTPAAFERAQRAWAAFEQAQLGADERNTWGQAEACLLLAQLELRQGNRAAARDRVEQALVLAPDYVAARELLGQIAAGK